METLTPQGRCPSVFAFVEITAPVMRGWKLNGIRCRGRRLGVGRDHSPGNEGMETDGGHPRLLSRYAMSRSQPR